jgi:cyclase
MKIVDLSSPVDASGWEPDEIMHRVMSAREGAEHCSAQMKEHFDLELDPDAFPDGEFLTNDFLTLTAHTGTHVDAPAHYGSRGPDGPPRTVDELPLEWFLAPGLVLDLRKRGVGVVDAAGLEQAMEEAGRRPVAGDIVLLHTGASQHVGTPRYFTDFAGLDRSATALLLDLGVRVIGTDAFSLDAPFPYIIKRYLETHDQGTLWPAHMLGREREYCQIERLANLEALDDVAGFRVACFPVKISGGGAGWTRAVALVEDETGDRP